MRYHFCAIAMAGVSVLFGVATADDNSAEKDLASLQGEWQCMSAESADWSATETESKAHKLTVKGNKASHLNGAKIEEATIKLNPSENPRTIDMSVLTNPKGAMLLGIYAIENDTLRICIGGFGEKRPTEFKSGEKTALFLFKPAAP